MCVCHAHRLCGVINKKKILKDWGSRMQPSNFVRLYLRKNLCMFFTLKLTPTAILGV